MTFSLSHHVTLMIQLYYALLIVGYLLKPLICHIRMTYHLSVHLITAYHTHHISTCQILTHNASLAGLVCCVESVNKVLLQCLDHHCVNTYVFIIIPIAIAGIALVIMLFTFNLTVTNGIIIILIFMSTLSALTIHNFASTTIHQIA